MNVIKINDPVFKNNMASFDYDWTLVSTKKGNTFPTDIDDWEWLYTNIPDTLTDLHKKGFMIVIFTNQSKSWKQTQIVNVMEKLNIPLYIVIATSALYYKPNKLLFDLFDSDKKINKNTSFYIGDALGRKIDFSDSDKMFAINIGLPFFSPEEFFQINNNHTFNYPIIPLSISQPEIIIMMGFPGSGKTTLAKHISNNNSNYVILERDIYKTVPKMLKYAKTQININKSVIFDATNSSIKNRKIFIDFATQNKLPVKCIHVNTSLLKSLKRNRLREEEKQVPQIAYSVYSKYYETPNESEGFELITASTLSDMFL